MARFYSYGPASNSSNVAQALGSVSTNSSSYTMGVEFINNTGSSLNQITLSYLGEEWHLGTNTGTQTLNFGYAVQATPGTMPISGATGVSALNFTSPVTSTGTGMELDGMLSANQHQFTNVVVPLSTTWGSGQALWLTWQMVFGASQQPGLAIDNVSFSATTAVTTRNIYWIGASGGTWDGLAPNWTTSSTATTPTTTFAGNTDVVTFDSAHTGIIPGTVNIASGGVTPNSTTFANATGTYTLVSSDSKGLGGTGSLTMSGAGNLILQGTNTYSGGTSLNAGTTSISADANLGATTGALTINGGTLAVTAGIASTRAITIGTNGATISIPTGDDSTFGAASAATAGVGSFTKTGSGRLTLSGGILNPNVTISAGTLALAAGTSALYVSSSNTLVGNLAINGSGATVDFDAGSWPAAATFGGGGNILVEATGEAITTGSAGTSTIVSTIANNVILNSNNVSGAFVTSIGATKGGLLSLNNPISGASDLILANSIAGGGKGFTALNAVNTYSGAIGSSGPNTYITGNAGAIVGLGVSNALPTNTALVFGAPSFTGAVGALDLNGWNQTVASLSSSTTGTIDGITNSAGALGVGGSAGTNTNSTLTINGSATTTYAGTIGTITADVGSTAAVALVLAPTNTGSLTLGGANTYSGNTTINGGTLLAANITGTSASGTGTVTVGGSSAIGSPTLGGNGIVTGSVTINSASGGAAGHLAPGLGGTGTLSLTGGLTLNNGTVLNYTLGSAGTQASVSGAALTIGTGITLNVTRGLGFTANTPYVLLHYSSLTDNTSTFSGWTVSGAAGDTAAFSLDTNGDNVDVTFTPIRTVYWIGAGGATWNTATANWTTSASAATPTTTFSASNPDTVIFDGTAAHNQSTPGTVNIAAGGVSPAATTFSNATGTYTLASSDSTGLAGGGSLTMSGAGTLVLTGTNTYSGSTNLNAGTISIASDASLGAVGVGLSFSGGTLRTTAAITSPRSLLVASGGGTLNTGTLASTFGSATLVGQLTLSGSGSLAFTNGVTFNGGTLAAATVPVAAGPITVNAGGGTFNTGTSSSTSSTAGAITATGTLTISGSGALAASSFSGAGNLTVTGGATTLTGGFNGTGALAVNGGTLTVDGSGSSTGLNPANSTTFTFSVGSGGTLALVGGTSNLYINTAASNQLAGNLVIGGSSPVVNLNTPGTTVNYNGGGSIQVQSNGALIITGSATSNNLQTISDNIVLNSTNQTGSFLTTIGATSGTVLVLANPISGAADLQIANATNGGGKGDVALSGQSTYSGQIGGTGPNTFITANTTSITALGVSNALPTNTNLVFGSPGFTAKVGALDLNGWNQTVASLNSSTTGTIDGITNSAGGFGVANNGPNTNSTLTINGSATTTYAGTIGTISADAGSTAAVALALASTNTGSLTLSVANTYSGGTTINGGTLIAGNATASSATGTGSVTVGGSSALGTPKLAGGGFISGLVTINGASGGAAGHLSPGTSGTGTLTLTGGLTLGNGANLDYTLGTTSTLTTVSGAAVTLGTGLTLNVTQAAGFALGTNYQLIHYSSLTNNTSGSTGWTATGAPGDSPTFTIDSVNSNVDVSFAQNRIIYWIGASGGTWNTVNSNWSTSSSANTPTTVFSSVNQDNVTFDSAHTGVTPGIVNIAAGGVTPGTTTFSNATGTYTLVSSDSIGLAGSGSLTMSGAGNLVLQGTNSYAGGTFFNGSVTSISTDASLGAASGALTFNGGTLQTTAAVASTRNITVNATGGTIDTDGFSFATSGTTTINGTLTKLSAGNLALNGAVTFGTTAGDALTISAGSVTLGQTAGTVTQTFGGTYNGNLVIGGPIRANFDGGTFSGSGQIQVVSTGTSITNSNGGTVTGGTVNVPIVLNSGGASFTAGDVAAASFQFGSFVTSIGGTAGATGSTVTLGGTISGNSDVNIANSAAGGGSGNLTLNAASSYTGTTEINANKSTIKLGINNALPTGTNVIDGTQSGFGTPTLDLNGNNQQIASLSDGADVSSSAFLTITNNNTTASSPSVLTVSGSVVPATGFSGRITNGATNTVALVKAGTNTLTLSGLNTYSGGTTINGGTLLAANASGSSATGTGSVTVGGSSANGTPKLAGTGFIGGLVTINGASGGAAGHLSPGSGGAGTLTLNGGLTLANGADLDFTLGTSSTSATVSGAALTLGTGMTLNVTQGTGFATGTTYQLIHYTSLTNNSTGFSGWTAAGVPGDTPTFSLDTTNDFIDVSFATGSQSNSQTTTALSGTVANGSTFPTAFGPPVQWAVADGGSFAALQSSVTGATGSGGGPLLTHVGGGALTATILAGVNSGTFTGSGSATLTESWRTRTPFETSRPEGGTPSSPPLQYVGSYLISNVLNLGGMGTGSGEPNQTDPFVLQMQYNQSLLSGEAAQAKKGTIYLGWLNPNGGGAGVPQWQKAFTGDFTNVLTGGGTVTGAGANGKDVATALGINFQGTFDAFVTAEETAHSTDFPGNPTAANLTDQELSFLLGAYGVDTGGHDVWAVINHNSQFAVVPEPSSVVLAALGLVGIAGYRRRRKLKQPRARKRSPMSLSTRSRS